MNAQAEYQRGQDWAMRFGLLILRTTAMERQHLFLG